MSIKEAEGKIAALEAELHTLAPMDPHAEELRTTIATLREEAMRNMDAWDTVYLARHPKRPKAMDYIHALFPDFLELHGDRAYGDDAACSGCLYALPQGGAHICFEYVIEELRDNMEQVLDELCKKKEKTLLAQRYEKYRAMGANYEEL